MVPFKQLFCGIHGVVWGGDQRTSLHLKHALLLQVYTFDLTIITSEAESNDCRSKTWRYFFFTVEKKNGQKTGHNGLFNTVQT